MKLAPIVLGSIIASACSTLSEMRQAGFTEQTLLRLEKEDWGQPSGDVDWVGRAHHMDVPVTARPIAIRDLRCRQADISYSCDFLIDYGENGQIEGTYKVHKEPIVKDGNGNWIIGFVITGD